MTLENLLTIHRLVRHEASAASIRKQGDSITEATLDECIRQAEALLGRVASLVMN